MTALEEIVAKISLGALCPTMTVKAGAIESADKTETAICIEMMVVHADEPDDNDKMRLAQVYPVPSRLQENETALVRWILERVKDVMLHEVEEFFRYNGKQVVYPAHPMVEDTYVR